MPVTASEYAALAYAAYGPEEGGDVDDKIYEFSDGKIEKGTFELLESTNEFIVVRKVSTGETVLSVKGMDRLLIAYRLKTIFANISLNIRKQVLLLVLTLLKNVEKATKLV